MLTVMNPVSVEKLFSYRTRLAAPPSGDVRPLAVEVAVKPDASITGRGASAIVRFVEFRSCSMNASLTLVSFFSSFFFISSYFIFFL